MHDSKILSEKLSEKNKMSEDLLCERRTVLRSAASSKSFIVFTLGAYLVAAVGASWEPNEIQWATPRSGGVGGGSMWLNLRKRTKIRL